MKRHANLSVFVPHVGCPQRCVFCNQNEISGESCVPSPEDVEALCERFLPGPGSGKGTEIAFFGGSFTAIDRRLMESLLEAAHPFVRQGRACGIRLSTRPDAIDREILSLLRRYDVSAVELGAQSMDDSVLLANRRGHTADDVRAASRLIKDGGFSLGLQMMLGMLGEKDPAAGARETAREFCLIAPDTVRIYPTIVVESTGLCALYREGKYLPLTAERAIEITAGLLELFEEKGINVIRVGLHSDESLRSSVVAGPFHPAFGERCYSLAARRRIEKLIDGVPCGSIALAVPPRDVSRTVGYKRENIAEFQKSGYSVSVTGDSSLCENEIRIIR